MSDLTRILRPQHPSTLVGLIRGGAMPKSFVLKRPAFVGRSARVVKAEADFYEKTRRRNPANPTMEAPMCDRIENRRVVFQARP